MLSFTRYLTESNWMYHGTPADFSSALHSDPSNHMIDRAIGVHFAADASVSTRFAKGLYRDKPQSYSDSLRDKPPTGPTGFIYRVKAPTDGRSRIVAQKTYHFPQYSRKGSDQTAVGAYVAATVFEAHPELFIDWAVSARNISKDLATRLYDAMKNHRPAPKDFEKTQNQSLQSLIANFDSGLFMLNDVDRSKLVQYFDDIMAGQGIDALVYMNTSPMETNIQDGISVRSTKSYILLNHAIAKYPVEKIAIAAFLQSTAA